MNLIAKSNLLPGMLLLCSLTLVMLLSSSCSQEKAAHEHDEYTCPMHPTVVSDRPGTCPVCGMDLVRKVRPGEEIEITGELATMLKSPNEVVIASIKTVKGQFMKAPVSIRAEGVVTYDTRNIHDIPARISGRLEKVYIKYRFQKISKGQKVAEIYSPALVTAQRELLFLLEHDADNDALIAGAKERLVLLGTSEAQINELVKTGQVKSTFTLYSPHEGYITTEDQGTSVTSTATSQPGTGMGGGMGNSNASSYRAGNSTEYELPRAGSYVSTGQSLFTVVNPAALRIEINLSSTNTALVKVGQPVSLTLQNHSKLLGNVDFVQPFFDEGEEQAVVRIYTAQTRKLLVGQLVKAEIEGAATEALWVPAAAILTLGQQHIVFVKEKGVFKPREVTVGVTAKDMVSVVKGISSAEEIAANAYYLIDSESFIKTKR